MKSKIILFKNLTTKQKFEACVWFIKNNLWVIDEFGEEYYPTIKDLKKSKIRNKIKEVLDEMYSINIVTKKVKFGIIEK